MVLPLVSGALAFSCIYEGERPCPDRLSFAIVNDWQAAPDASPEGMAYIFFPDDRGEAAWRFDFPGREAGPVAVATGGYRFLSFNDDTYRVAFRGEGSYETYEAYTPPKDLLGAIPAELRGSKAPAVSDERVVGCPDMMWGCAYGAVGLSYDQVRFVASASVVTDTAWTVSPGLVLPARQRRLTARYSCRIEQVENLAGVKSMSAALSGMAGSMMLASGERGDYPSTLAFGASVVDSSTVASDFCCFGLRPDPVYDNVLNLFVVIKDGRRFSYEFDVTDQVRSAPDPMNVHIVVRGLTLEIPEEGGDTGFDVAVDGWETVVVNIKG